MRPSPCRIYIDVETTGLGKDRRVYDVGMVILTADGGRREHSYLISDVDLRGSNLFTLEIGHFAERHPLAGGHPEYNTEVLPEKDVARLVFDLTYGATVAGIVVNFDTEALTAMLERHGLCWPAWHHTGCVEGWALGALATHASYDPVIAEHHAELLATALQPPGRWKTDPIAAAFGVPAMAPAERHTGIGDARLAERIFTASILDRVKPVPDAHWSIPTALLPLA